MNKITRKSPGKINTFLRIVKQESNGYHYLQTIFQFIDLADEITFETRDDDQIITNYHNESITPDNDLIIKAVKILQTKANITNGLNIYLQKTLPMGAGIGGGSSNAATTLVALNELWQLNYSNETLQLIGKTLGADVPIFIYGKSAWAEGIGEIFHDVSPKEKEYLLLIPSFGIKTADIFTYPDLSRSNEILKITDNPPYLNDCTSAIFAIYPDMKRYMETLTAFGLNPKITGTGSCIYIDKPALENKTLLMQFLHDNRITYKAIKTMNQSPLYCS